MKIFHRDYLKKIGKIIVATFSGFIDDNGLKLSASLAFYTVFSLAPLLILFVSLADLFFRKDVAANTLYPEIAKYIGPQAAIQIQETLKNLQLSGKTNFALVIGVITLLLGASSIFVEIQESLNMIWRVKAKPKRGWVKLLENRFLSFSLIISLSFLLLVTLVVNLLMNLLSEKIKNFLPDITGLLIKGINLGLTLLVISVLFAIIFRFLPDVKIKWRDGRSGAVFTALLFMLGQYVIGLYIQYTAQGSAYGAAGSIIVILLWIYYTAAILYIGAEFTQVWAEAKGSPIEPADYAVYVKQTEVEAVVKTLPAQNPEIKGQLKDD